MRVVRSPRFLPFPCLSHATSLSSDAILSRSMASMMNVFVNMDLPMYGDTAQIYSITLGITI